MSLIITGDKLEVRIDYLPTFLRKIIQLLVKEGTAVNKNI